MFNNNNQNNIFQQPNQYMQQQQQQQPNGYQQPYQQQQQQPYQNQTNNIFANPQNPNIFAQQGTQQNIFANQQNPQLYQQQPNQMQQQQNIFNQNQYGQQNNQQLFQNNGQYQQQPQQMQQQYPNNNNIFNQQTQQNNYGGMQNVFANPQNNNQQRNIFQNQSNNIFQNQPNNIFQQQQNPQGQQNIFATQNVFQQQMQQQPQNTISNTSTYVNPIIQNRRQQHGNAIVNPQQQGQQTSIFNNNNVNNTANIFANSNQQINNNNNNMMNRSIFNNNNNNNNVGMTPNIFSNNQTPNNTNNIFRQNVVGVNNHNNSIFSNNNVFNQTNNTTANIFRSNNNMLPNNSIYNQQVQYLNPLGQLQNGKIILPPPKKYQTRRSSDNIIDTDGWVGAYLQLKDDGKIIKLGKDKVEDIQEYLNIRPIKDRQQKSNMVEEGSGDLDSTYETEKPKRGLQTDALLGPLSSLDLNLSRVGVSLPNSFSSRYINNPRASLTSSLTSKEDFYHRSTSDSASKPLNHTQSQEEIEKQKRFELLLTRQNMYYEQKPQQLLQQEDTLLTQSQYENPIQPTYAFSTSRNPGILKKQSLTMSTTNSKNNLNDSFDENNRNRLRQQYLMNSSSNASRSALLSKGTLNMTQSLSGGFDYNKKHRFIHEMQKDPRNEMYLPRRIERLLVSATQDMSVDETDSTDSKQIDEMNNPLGLKPAVQITEMLRDSKDIQRSRSEGMPIVKGFDTLSTKDLDIEIICHVTNVSTKKSEKEILSNTKISTVWKLDVFTRNIFDLACRRTGLIWHRDYDECLRRSVVYIDENSKAMSFSDYSKSLRELGISKQGSFEVEFFISEAPILKGFDSLQCDPPIQQLQKMSVESLQKVDFFYVQNQHGSIEFEAPVDITRQNLDEVILIEEKKAHVYPEHIFAGRAPKKGAKLNQTAIVTLFCIDKAFITRALQDEASFIQLEEKLRRQTVKNHTEFIKLDPLSGYFSFRVFDWSC